jgi:hypothetical protein
VLGLAAIVLLGADTLTPTLRNGPLVYPNKWFDTELLMLLDVTRQPSGDDYHLMFGPLPSGSGPMTAMVGQDASGNWQTTIRENGFIYMTGIRPYGGTDGGSTTSDGSIMLVERTVNALGTAVSRFYYLYRTNPSHKMRVTNASDPNDKKDNAAPYQYIEKIGNGNLSNPLNIQVNSPEYDFVERVVDIAKVNNLAYPSWPPP